MPRLFDTFMFRDETAMLRMRLEEFADIPGYCAVLTEAPVTHRGLPKPCHYDEHRDDFTRYQSQIVRVEAEGLEAEMEPWAREHAQRDAAWRYVGKIAADNDIVLIADVDEFPSAEALAWRGPGVVSLWMRTMLHAVDWEVPPQYLPPTAVMCTAGWLRRQGGSLARVRDNRGSYRVIRNGGLHFSWIGGPEAAARKLEQSTCHTELLGTREGELIADGTRWRTGEHGEGHLPVVPAEVDETWPRMIRERRCPPEWLRPREPLGATPLARTSPAR